MSETVVIYILAITLCMVLSAFFSGSETALVSSNRMTIEAMSKKGNRRAKRSLQLLENIEHGLGMILIGNNVVNISAAAFLTYLATEFYYFSQTQIILLTALQTIVFLILSELTPKVFARSKSESFLMFFSFPLKLFTGLLYPITKVSLLFSKALKRGLKIEKSDAPRIKREEIDILFRIGGEAGVIGEENQLYVSEVLRFKNTMAVEIMTPTIDIISIEIDSSIKQLTSLIAKMRFTRIPVYRERVDNIIGYVFYRDILTNSSVNDISDIMLKAQYVPESKNIYDLHLEMQENVLPLVFVVNEYGAVIGMVSYEDIAEEVVGEIQSREHSNEELMRIISNNKYSLSGDLDFDYFARIFSLNFEKKGFKTIGGFIMYMLGKIPKKGDTLSYEQFQFIIDEATERSVERVIVQIRTQKK